MRVFLFYPPGKLFQRGEDRCMVDIKSSAANSMRACNDLGYCSSVLKKCGDEIFLKDYATEGLDLRTYKRDIEWFKPDVLVLSTTNTTIYDDIRIINATCKKTGFHGKVILKGAIFFNAPKEMFELLDLENVDILVGGEIEWVIKDIVHEKKPLSDIPYIYWKDDDHNWHGTDFSHYNEDLDAIPFPDRSLMNNSLYTRPDTGEAMATIQTGHGCPSNCIYCLTPQISGKRLRLRSPENVMAEIEECYHKYGIRNFFFRADTFTFKKEWVLELCDMIKKSDLYGHIQYTANSRVKPLSMDVLEAMKDTGCFTIAFGLETGSPETMKNIRKGVSVEDNYKAVAMAKQAGIPVWGFYMMGFPWETKESLKATKKMIFDLDCDFIEIYAALPFYGTELYKRCKDANVLGESIMGSDIFHASTIGTKHVSSKEIMEFRRRILLQYYTRPKYIARKMWGSRKEPKVVLNYAKYGIRLVGNMMSEKRK